MFHLNVESMFVWLISTLWSFHTFEFILQTQIFHINYNFSWSWLIIDANFVNKIILSTGKSLILSFIYFFLLKNKSLVYRMVSDWWVKIYNQKYEWVKCVFPQHPFNSQAHKVRPYKKKDALSKFKCFIHDLLE